MIKIKKNFRLIFLFSKANWGNLIPSETETVHVTVTILCVSDTEMGLWLTRLIW